MNTPKTLTKLQLQAIEIQKLKGTIKEIISSKKSCLNMSTHSALHSNWKRKTLLINLIL